MANKKTKLTLSGIAKKSIQNIELAKTQSKNTVVIEKKSNKFVGRGSFNRSADQSNKPQKKSFSSRPMGFAKPSVPITNNFEKRKLAEQRATRRVKGESPGKDLISTLVHSPSTKGMSPNEFLGNMLLLILHCI